MSTLLWLILLAIPILPNLWCIWHAYSRDFNNPNERMIWMGVGVFLPVVGGLLYLLIGRRRARPPQALEQPGDNLTK